MEITLDELEWHSDDRLALANFLSTPTGSKFLPKLAEMAPQLLKSGDTNAILIRAGEVANVQEFIRNVLTLARPEPAVPQTVDALPDLMDDSKWEGEKLKPTP